MKSSTEGTFKQIDFYPFYNMGVSLAQEDKYEVSMEYFQKALKCIKIQAQSKDKLLQTQINDQTVQVYTNMAIIQEKLLRFQESLDYLNLAEEVDPTSPKTKILKERITQILVGIENGTISASDYLSGYK